MQDLVFVCTGNICRSPMAEYLFREMIKDTHPDWRISSAGVAASYGIPASRFSVQALAEREIDLRPHRSQPVMPQMAANARLIIVMTSGHRAYLQDMYPATLNKTFLLMRFKRQATESDILDPIGLSLDVYRHVRDEITDALGGLVEHLDAFGNHNFGMAE